MIKSPKALESSSDPDATVNIVQGIPEKDDYPASYVYAAETTSDSMLPDATTLDEHMPSLAQSIDVSLQGNASLSPTRCE